MLAWLKRMVGIQSEPSPPVSEVPQLSAAGIEALIEEAGRAEVFSRARSLGWSPGETPPPLWVWATISRDIIAAKPAAPRILH